MKSNAIKRYQYTPIRMAKIKKNDNNTGREQRCRDGKRSHIETITSGNVLAGKYTPSYDLRCRF